MKINLNDATTLQSIGKVAMTDNRTIGLVGNKVLAEIFGGAAIGTGNNQRQWVRDGITYAVGTGNLKKAFVKSGNKGLGRSGKELKEGDAFAHLTVDIDENSVSVKLYSRAEAETFIQ